MEKPVKVRRQYRSGQRERQAKETRRAVLIAARELFVAAGYGATTLQHIADEAGVSVQTVYAAFGNKRTVLEQSLDIAIAGDDDPTAVNDRPWMRDVFEHPDPRTRLAAYAAAVRRIHHGAADMFAVVKAAAAIDHDLGAFAETTEDRRRTGARSVVAALATIGGLSPHLDEATATDIVWTLNSPEVFQLLVRRSGWDEERYERWLTDALQSQLLTRAPGR